MVKIIAAGLVGLAFACIHAPVARADVDLKPEEREHLGIQSEPVRVIESARRWSAAGTVIDIAPLITTLSDLSTAETTAAASRAEAERAEKLYHNDTNIARKTLDAARAQTMTDEGKVTAMRAQLLATFGRSMATLTAPARQQLISDLLSGRASLVRAEQLVPVPADAQIERAEITGLSGGHWGAASLGALPQAASAPSAGALLLRVRAALPTGQFLQVTLIESHSSLRGPTVPSAAIIRWHGEEWVYEESSPDHFTRRAVRRGPRVEGRALLEGEVPSNRRVVTVGARALLAAELGASDEHDEGAGE